MRSLGDGRLSHGHLAANGAALTLGQTGLGAGCCLADDDLLSVTKRGNGVLRGDHDVTYRAVLARGQTRCSAGRCNGSVNDLGVTGCGNGLGTVIVTAARTSVHLRTCGGTGSTLGHDPSVGVSVSGG